MPGNGKVFVSHTHEDNALCALLLKALDEWRIDYWFDTQRIEAGQDLSNRIQDAIAERDIFLRVCTAAVQRRPFWLNLEANAFRMLQAEDENAGLHGKRVFISLVLDRDYVLQPFERTVLYIEAIGKTPDLWLGELRRALGVASPSAATRCVPMPASFSQEPPRPPLSSEPSSVLPAKLVALGFTEHHDNGTHFILPPLCAVAGGPFWMGSDYQDDEASDDEKPRHAVDVPALSPSAHG